MTWQCSSIIDIFFTKCTLIKSHQNFRRLSYSSYIKGFLHNINKQCGLGTLLRISLISVIGQVHVYIQGIGLQLISDLSKSWPVHLKSYWDAGLIIIQCLQPEPIKLLYKLIVRSLTMSGRNSKSVTEYTWLSSGSEAMDFSSFSSIWAIPTRKMHNQIENYTSKQRLRTKIISVSSKWISQASLLLAKNRKLMLKLVRARLKTPEISLSTATFKCWDQNLHKQHKSVDPFCLVRTLQANGGGGALTTNWTII